MIGKAVEFIVVENPTPAELTKRLEGGELDIVHFSGFSNAQGLRELYNVQPHRSEAKRYEDPHAVPLDELLADPDRIQDGYLMSSPQGRWKALHGSLSGVRTRLKIARRLAAR